MWLMNMSEKECNIVDITPKSPPFKEMTPEQFVKKITKEHTKGKVLEIIKPKQSKVPILPITIESGKVVRYGANKDIVYYNLIIKDADDKLWTIEQAMFKFDLASAKAHE